MHTDLYLAMDFSAVSVFLVGNIPAKFHSYDLRAFFSHFIERRGFACFHFRHRPEYMHLTPPSDSGRSEEMSQDGCVLVSDHGGDKKKAGSVCCVVAVKRRLEKEFVKLYHGKNWSGLNGESLLHRVKLKPLTLKEDTADDAGRTGGLDPPIGDTNELTVSDLRALPEFNPPHVMPQGNVGTCLAVFMGLIRACRLPSFVIRKLRLEFPKSRSKRRYGAVPPLDFLSREGDQEEGMGGNEKGGSDESASLQQEGTLQPESMSQRRIDEGLHHPSQSEDEHDSESNTNIDIAKDVVDDDDDEDDDAEEWERYEALHDDVDKQERTKERLYEEEMEVVWEKGGSGLVFYTDASHWDQQDGDFDEKCSQEDDWDVDMSLYYNYGNYESADRYAVEMRDMARWKRLKAGEVMDEDETATSTIESGIGSRVLRQSGWREGTGLGRTGSGISHPVEPEGQLPHCKKGLGYHGEKLDTSMLAGRKRKQRATHDVLISTVYDKPDEPPDTPMRSAPATTIKYRQQVKFVGAGLLHPSRTQVDDDTTQEKDRDHNS